MRGEIDPILVEARTALLDALDALLSHRDSIVLIGAQAVYLRSGSVHNNSVGNHWKTGTRT